jgi:Do/DeqQ family serine protease
MNKYKYFGLLIVITTLFQCQAKPKENQLLENGNYKELTELIKSYNSNKGGVSFVAAAALSTPCVVHIKTKIQVMVQYQDPFHGFFGSDFYKPRAHNQESSGSGVIISSDGYIATNYHVIQNATEIEVTLRNKNTYKAKVIGRDKDTDLALLKIEENELPAMQIANSDSVLVGEWVLAVGNPFNLESTVTQGIVSAKGRSLNMGKEGNAQNPIQSFIQTDAAVNPGNSGGALVNLNGELIGINTAIASPTGTYAGYAFAVPSNIVKKVIEDLMKHGNVQRAFLGIQSVPLTSELAKKLSLPSPNGVLIKNVFEGSAADASGLKANDVITKVNSISVTSFPELLEQISTHRPGEKIKVEYIRNGVLANTDAILKNELNTTEILNTSATVAHKLGIKTQSLTEQEILNYRITGGLKVMKINHGIIAKSSDMKPGFIITSMNDIEVKSESDFNKIISQSQGNKLVLEGFYPNRPYIVRYEILL